MKQVNHPIYSQPIFARYTSYIAGIIFLLGFQSCSKDDFIPDNLKDPDWSPELALPLAYSEIGIDDLAHNNDTSTVILVDANQFCTLLYKGRVFELDGKQLIQVPDQMAGQSFQLNSTQISALNASGQVLVTGNQNITFSVSQGVEIDSMTLAGGILEFEILSQFPLNANVRITLPAMKNAGLVFSQSIDLIYNGMSPVQALASCPLANYKVDLSQGGTGHNMLQIQFAVTFQGNSSQVNSSQTLQIDTRMKSMDYSMIYGYAGQQTLISPPDSVAISIFKNALGSGSFSIANPTITFDISNSVGIPFLGRVPSLTGLNHNMTSYIACTGIPDPLPLTSPSLTQVGQTMHSGFSLNSSNSNIMAMIQNNPAWLIASTQTSTNPSGYARNYIPGDGKLVVDMTLSLPLHGTATNFVIRDTLPFTYNDLDKVESFTLRLGIENWFPLESNARLIFTDDQFNPLDSVFTNSNLIIPSGKIQGNSERVSIPGYKIAEEKLDVNRINKIKGATKIIVETIANTVNNGTTDVKIYHDYKMKVNIGARVKLKVK